MEPQFATAVDPVFLGAIELQQQARSGAARTPQEERSEMQGLISRAENALIRSEEWELAKYALVHWIDTQMSETPWEGQQWWQEHSLEREHFYEGASQAEFFVRARHAGELSKKNALEVFYVCVVMGFRGIYADPSGEHLAADRGLPESLDAWAQETAQQLHLGMGRPPIHGQPRPLDGAPPLNGKSRFLVASTVAAISLALPMGYFLLRLL